MELLTGALAAKTISGAWFVRECFSLIWKVVKHGNQNYRPDSEWKKFCTERFEELSDENKQILERLHKLFTAQEVMKVKITHIEKELSR